MSAQRSRRDSRSREQCAGAAGELGFDFGQAGERAADEGEVARAGAAGGHAGQQALEVVDLRGAIRGASCVSAGVGDEFGDGVEPGVDRGDVGERRGEPIGEQPGAERSDGAIDRAEERTFAAAVADRFGDLQAAARGGIDREAVVGRIGREAIDVGERRLLRFAQVIEDRAGGAERGGIGSGWFGVEAEAVERAGAEVFGERLRWRRCGRRSRRGGA